MPKMKLALPLIVLILVTMACTIGYEGVAIGSDPEVDFIEDQTATAGAVLTGSTPQPPEAAVTESANQTGAAQGASGQSSFAGENEYAVEATNFGCICQVDGNVTASFTFNGDQLEYTTPGGAVDVYDKIGENTYKRTFMGYYILTSGEGDNLTETKVEEERHVIITLNDGGYIMEHYQGAESSPCCFHTFTQK